MSNIDKKIKKFREDLCMSQATLADASELTPAAICQFESGKKTPSLKTLKRIATALRISVNDLMGNEKSELVDDDEVSIKFRGFSDMTATNKAKVVEYFRFLQTQNKKKKKK